MTNRDNSKQTPPAATAVQGDNSAFRISNSTFRCPVFGTTTTDPKICDKRRKKVAATDIMHLGESLDSLHVCTDCTKSLVPIPHSAFDIPHSELTPSASIPVRPVCDRESNYDNDRITGGGACAPTKPKREEIQMAEKTCKKHGIPLSRNGNCRMCLANECQKRRWARLHPKSQTTPTPPAASPLPKAGEGPQAAPKRSAQARGVRGMAKPPATAPVLHRSDPKPQASSPRDKALVVASALVANWSRVFGRLVPERFADLPHSATCLTIAREINRQYEADHSTWANDPMPPSVEFLADWIREFTRMNANKEEDRKREEELLATYRRECKRIVDDAFDILSPEETADIETQAKKVVEERGFAPERIKAGELGLMIYLETRAILKDRLCPDFDAWKKGRTEK